MNEFPVALAIFFLIIAFPLIDLLGLTAGATTALMIAHQSAARAASVQRYDTALSVMNNEAQNLLGTGFAAFAHLTPAGGYKGCGADLYVVESNYRNNGVSKTYGPNSPVTSTIDPSTYLYECSTKVTYQVGPTISLASVPFIGDVPGLGKPAVITFTANRAAEFPMGLNNVGDVASNRMASGNVGVVDIPWDSASNPSGSNWNFPDIYQIITSAGFTPYDDDVAVVLAKNPNWTPTVINVGLDDHLYFDVRKDSTWTLAGVVGFTTAAGCPSITQANGLPAGALIARVGSGKPFLVGINSFNVTGKGTGMLQFMMNDGAKPPGRTPFVNNQGCQVVRAVVAR